MGPIGGILICDYFVIRRTVLYPPQLYRTNGRYAYRNGFNPDAMIALFVAIVPNVPGFLNAVGATEFGPFWTAPYHYAWFIGFALAFALYYVLTRLRSGPAV